MAIVLGLVVYMSLKLRGTGGEAAKLRAVFKGLGVKAAEKPPSSVRRATM